MKDTVIPVRLTDDVSGKVYELDFNRASLVFAERRGFEVENAIKYPITGLRELFYYSFRMNHKEVSREKADEIFDRWGGAIPKKLVDRLIQLYLQAQNANSVLMDDEEPAKNVGLTLEL